MAQRRVLIVTEKPHHAHVMRELWEQRHPDDHVLDFCTPPRRGSFRYHLPRDLPLSAVPIIADVVLERDFTTAPSTGVLSVFNQPFCRLADSADLLVCATDPDPEGTQNFLDLLSGHDINTPHDQIQWVRWVHMTPEGAGCALDEGLTVADPAFEHLAGSGKAKQYFDYLWTLNSLPVFGELLRATGAADELSRARSYSEEDGDFWSSMLSKYALQALLLLEKDEAREWKRGEVSLLMHGNPLSKKESPIGTAMSRETIVDWLIRADLLEYIPAARPLDVQLRISERGEMFLGLLHKDCFDPDLAHRIAVWGQTWPESKPQIDRYIRTFFGKQLRFQSRALRC